MPREKTHSLEHPSLASKSRRQNGEDGRDFGFRGSKQFADDAMPLDDSNLPDNSNPIETAEIKLPDSTPSVFVAPQSRNAERAAEKEQRKRAKRKIETWLQTRGHGLTFALIFAFTVFLYFRPYELIPFLSPLKSMAYFLAAATIILFIPSQLATENTLTARPAEVNYILLLTLFAIITIPIARDPMTAWETLNDPFIKVVLIFIVMVNVVRTEKRLKWMLWLALGVGVMLAVGGISNYSSGNATIEGYRSVGAHKGMFGNPNAQAMHFVSITPIAVALAMAHRNWLIKFVYFGCAALFVAGNMVTFSRGGFLGLAAAALMLAWKYGRGRRVQVMALCVVGGAIFLAVAPGGYGVRVLSIFFPALDPVGSSSHRSDLLKTSILVSLRNPWGIGMNNFIFTNPRGLLTHNSYTQVSAELGVLGLIAYIMFIFEPLRRLFWMEREMIEKKNHNWIYHLNIGLQASIVGYCVSSFFDAAAYQWFLYYIVAYAICLRRIYQLDTQNAQTKTGRTNEFVPSPAIV